MTRFLRIAWLLVPMMLIGCKPSTITNIYNSYYGVADTDSVDTDPPIVSPVVPSVAAADFKFDIFDHKEAGTVLWIDVSDSVVQAMNADWQMGGFGGGGMPAGIYNVDDLPATTTVTDHLYFQRPDASATDYGQVGAGLAGQSTGYIWDATSIPNFNFDADKVVDGERFGGKYEHLRLNNAMVGSMFGEPTALAMYALLGIPAPRTNYVLIGSRVWGQADKLIPYVAVEKYKKAFCEEHADAYGGGCVNIWEGSGIDVTNDAVAWFDQACDLSSCDTTRLKEFADVVTVNLGSSDFEEATAPYFDWPAYQKFQCAEWLLWTGDDALHNMNNIVLIEGMDGRFRYQQYSTDITAGLAWYGAYSDIPLYGFNAMSTGCQMDEACWAETISTCEGMIAKFAEADPVGILNEEQKRLRDIVYPWGDDGGDGALRTPDEGFFAKAQSFYSTRAANALVELDQYRAPQTLPDTGMADSGAGDTDAQVVLRMLATNRHKMRTPVWPPGLDPKHLPVAYPQP